MTLFTMYIDLGFTGDLQPYGLNVLICLILCFLSIKWIDEILQWFSFVHCIIVSLCLLL